MDQNEVEHESECEGSSYITGHNQPNIYANVLVAAVAARISIMLGGAPGVTRELVSTSSRQDWTGDTGELFTDDDKDNLGNM